MHESTPRAQGSPFGFEPLDSPPRARELGPIRLPKE